MRACRYDTHADPPAVRIEEIRVPEPGPGEALVRVRAASLNPVDWKIATGKFRFLVKGGLPRTMGSDFAGEIAATGPGVTGWRAGEPVMGFIDPFKRLAGTFAEFVPVPVEFLTRRPAGLDESVAAALPAVGVTAVALCDLAGVGPGSSVLVNGAAGGVGHLALQVAKARGALVAVTAGAPRREWLTALGADEFIDYTTRPVEHWPIAFDAVLDCVPNLPRRRHRRLLRRGGRYASTLPNGWTYTLDPLLNRVGPVARSAVMLQPDAVAMQELLGYVADGRLHCEIADSCALERVADAIEQSRRGHVRGKLVIRVD